MKKRKTADKCICDDIDKIFFFFFSNGYFLFSLRIWSVVWSSWVTIGLWWLLSLALYLLLDLYISSLIVGILKSRWIVSLVTYQGAFIRDLSVVAALDSKLPNGFYQCLAAQGLYLSNRWLPDVDKLSPNIYSGSKYSVRVYVHLTIICWKGRVVV